MRPAGGSVDPRPRPVASRRLLGVFAGCTAVLLSGCSTTGNGAGHPGADGAATPSRLAAASILMTGASSGYAVLPSGPSWVLLSTRDGWSQLGNATPAAVPTGGGIALAAANGEVAAGIGPYDQLISSPILTSSDPAHGWTPAELPAGLADSRHAIALDSGTTTAVLTGGGGSLVRRAAAGWTTLSTAKGLQPSGRLTLDSISWAAGGVGWLTGHGPAGTAIAFTSKDNGASWTPVPGLPGNATAALAPCGAGQSWQLPVLAADGTVRVYRSTDGGQRWQPGASVPVAGNQPVWGCHGDGTWLLGVAAGGNRLLVSTDAGTSWRDAGAAPRGITDLAMVDASSGFAAGQVSTDARLWSVSVAGSAGFQAITLPGWLSTIGGSGGDSD